MTRSTFHAACCGALALLLVAPAAHGWGANGHRVVGQIAEDRLSDATREEARRLLGGLSLAQVSTWPDFIRSEPGWKIAGPWHFFTVEDDQQVAAAFMESLKTPEPDDVAEAIVFFADILRGDAAKAALFQELMDKAKPKVHPFGDSVKATALIFLVHMVGDIHQPLHVGRGDDRGANSISVNWFDEIKNLHSVWDSGLIESEDLSFTELTEFIENEYGVTAQQWKGGGPADWAQESRDHRLEVYRIWSKTSRTNHLPELSYDYAHDHIGTVKLRLFQGGVRLAEMLESILGGGAE